MKISLVVATVGRSSELERLFSSLQRQCYRNFETVVVDQNLDERVERVIRSHGNDLEIQHLHSDLGLSKARNLGLQSARGEILGFPDDDSWYPADLLQRVASFFERSPTVGGVSGRSVDASGRDSSKFDRHSGWINRFNVWTRSNSNTIFLRREVARDVGAFDERLGVGAQTPYGSGEETDYLLRALAHGYKLFYESSLVVNHAQLIRFIDAQECARGRSYARGTGYVLRRHGYPVWFPLYQITRSLGGTFLSVMTLDFARARFRLNILIGRTRGWIAND